MNRSGQNCRVCNEANCLVLGQLPDRNEFAGLTLPGAIPGGELLRCSHCYLVFRSPILSSQKYNELYSRASALVWSLKGQNLRPDQSLVKRYLESLYPHGGKLLDIGCYTGDFLSCMPKHEKYGIEMSEKAAQLCQERGITILGNDLYKLHSLENKFDAVIAMDVIEHTENPAHFLRSALNLVSQSGVLIITTGDADNWFWRKLKANFWYCTYAEHISFISENWLKCNPDANYEIVQIERFRYEQNNRLVPVIRKLLTIFGLPLLGKDFSPFLSAHIAKDHLFIVLKRKINAPEVRS